MGEREDINERCDCVYGRKLVSAILGRVAMDIDGLSVELRGGFYKTTNNRMEMMAVIEDLAYLTDAREVVVYTDFQYIANAINQGWAPPMASQWLAAQPQG